MKRTSRSAAATSSPTGGGRKCATMEVHSALLERVEGYAARLHALEHSTQLRLMAVQPPWKPVTIPVVVNVVYRTAGENLPDAQIQSQIDSLNADYTATNPDKATTPAPFAGRIGDPGVRFKLVKIVRKKTTQSSFGASGDPVKKSASGGVPPTDSKSKLNLWACTLGDGLLGYAQFPLGPVETDGVVILNKAFGTVGALSPAFNLGRTATHEIGHWLNLRHIWGDSPDCGADDGVADTPIQGIANTGVPTFPHISCHNGPHGDLFMNYMDYTDDRGMVMFTHGQVERMHAALLGPRKAYRV